MSLASTQRSEMQLRSGLRPKQRCRGSYSAASQILLVLRGRFVVLRGGDRKEGEGQEGSWESNGDNDSDAKLLSNRLNCQLIGGGGGGVEP